MSKPFNDLDTQNVDEQIEQILQNFPEQQNDLDTRFIRDLEYIQRKEQMLAHAKQRLFIVEQPEPTSAPFGSNEILQPQPNTTLSRPQRSARRKMLAWPQIAAILAAVVLLVGALIGTTQFMRQHAQTAAPGPTHPHPRNPNTGTSTEIVPTISTGTILFSDPLNQNTNNWPVGDIGSHQYSFENGAYHILNNSTNGAAVVNQQQTFPQTTLSYQITMEEVKGDDTSPNNTFGLILRYNTQTSGGNSSSQFYTFEVLNEGGSAQYGFYKYDSSQSKPWGDGPLWSTKAGNEFHQGQGSGAFNTVKVSTDGSTFTFYVNGQKVGTSIDASFSSGSMGMLVNLKGTEVAFSNMLVTQP